MGKANVAVAIIAKNSENTIGDCLRSIVPYVKQVVVCVDGLSTDGTGRVAKRYGAQVFRDFSVSEDHECPHHGKIKAQHFARARQASFAKLRTDVDWHMWVDADDVVKGGERLQSYLESLDASVDGVWLAYHYATAGKGGPTSTLFDRERLVRTNRAWEWQHRVHEILAPVGAKTEHLTWTRTDEISIHHREEGHDTAGSAKRNIILLEIDLEENPNDLRAWFYLGNQYFALQEWEAAANCYEQSTSANNPYQLWQSLLYLSMAYEKLGQIELSKQAVFRAIDVQPSHPEPYYRLATVAMLVGDVARAEYWTAMGDRLPDPPHFVFRNPLDRSYNARLTLAQAYANDGQTTRARQQLELAARVIPSKEVLEGIRVHRELEQEAQTADAWVKVLNQVPNGMEGSQGNHLGRYIPDNIWKFGRVRDVIIPQILIRRGCPKPRIIFFCGKSIEPWAPPSLGMGIGGSETAVIQIAKRFAQDGWWVDVYNDCDKYEGEYEGVGYWDLRRLESGERADVLVSWRNPAVYDLPIERRMSLLWMHDLNKGNIGKESLAKWDRVLGVSAWHAEYLSKVYDIGNTGYVPNGIELDRFTPGVKKVPFRCVYGSSPDRGLDVLLQLWPVIVAQEPKAELHIAYGWDTIDRMIALGYTDLAQLKASIGGLLARTPNVVWRGRLGQAELARLYQESYCWLYPTSFLEVSCITAMEAMAGGCIPVVSGAGALPETVGDAGLVVTGNTYSFPWKEFWVQCAKAALLNPNTRVPLIEKGLVRAKTFTWENAYDLHWRNIVESILIKNGNGVE